MSRNLDFSGAQLERQLTRDALLRGAVFALIILLIVLDPILDDGQNAASLWMILAAVGVWVALSVSDSRVALRLPEITAAIEFDQPRAQELLHDSLRRWPLHRSLRLTLHHRLAVLRHAQQNHAQSAAICQALLSRPLGAAEVVRPHLYLMFIEARLNAGDVLGAYDAILRVHRCKLTLVELLQLTALQTRYELMSGQPAAALKQLTGKVRLSELMPAAQCGGLNFMLALAAQRSDKPDLAAWLMRRAELLCSPPQLALLRRASGLVGEKN